MATINGTAANDVITGTIADDIIDGGLGNDRINGGAGNDVLIGGEGTDTLTGDAGNDTLFGGNGNDGFYGGGNDDTIYGEAGDDTMFGDAGNDTLNGGDGNDNLTGGTGNDTFYGGAGVNTYVGGAGIDTVVLELSSATLTQAMISDLGVLKAVMEDALLSAGSIENQATQTTGSSLKLTALGITISTIETVKIMLDGVETPIDSFFNSTPETAADVALTTDEDAAISGQVTATDADGDTLGYAVAQGPANGTLALNASTGAYTYTPGANFNGSDTFQVVVADPSGATAVQTVTVGVTPVNDAPLADASAAITTDEDTAISGQVVASDIDGDTLGYAVVQGPANGAVTLNASTGEYTYAPGANFNGLDTFQVVVADPSGATAVQTVTVGVTPVNDAPVADASAALATSEDKAVSGQVVASDIDGDTLAFALTAAPVQGTVALDAATGQYTYTPAANFSGDVSFDVTVTDPAGATSLQRVSVSVSPVADMPTLAVVNPVIIPDVLGTSSNILAAVLGTIYGSKSDDVIDAGIWEEITAAIEIDAALTDTDGSETLSIRISNVPEGGVLSAGVQNSDGSWTLTPDELQGLTVTATVDQNFTVNVETTATEQNGATATKTASISIEMRSDGVTINGGGGNDSISGSVGNDTLSGGNGNDTMRGGEGADQIYGGKGNDHIYGGAGNDYLNGNSGNDTFYADAGNDVYAGGSGYDTLTYADAASGITADLSKKIILGSATGTDTIYGSAMEKVAGSGFDDIFKGSSAVDTIDAGAGNDWLRGLGGSDFLSGGAGSDTFFWEKADVGGKLGVDHITDFSVGDVLDFTKLVSVGSNAVSDVVKVTDSNSGSIVSAKIGGTFVNVATLDGVHGKTATDLFHDGHLLVG